MNTRIKKLRKSLGLSGEKFGKRLGITRGAISNIENGSRSVTEQMIKSICREFNVNELWLRTGEGDMFPEVPNSTMEQLKTEYDLDEFSYALIEEYLKLSTEKRKVVRELFFNIMEKEKELTDSAIKEENTGQLSLNLEDFSNFPKNNEPDRSVEDIEAEYKKMHSSSALKKDVTVLNTTEDTEREKSIANNITYNIKRKI